MTPTRGRLLLTGASGFLGRAATALLERRGWEVVRAVREPRDVGSIKLDLSDIQSVAKLDELTGVNAIVHIAAKVDFTASLVDDFFKENITAVALLLAIAKEWGAHFVFTSAASVNKECSTDAAAGANTQPENAYIKSKWFGEVLAAMSGVDTTVLRCGGIFGWKGPEHLGLNRAIAAAAGGKRPVLIGEGRARRNYVYVGDVAAQVAYALEHRVLGTHVVAGTETLSIREMLEAVCEAFLPGLHPDRVAGPEAADQIFAPSAAFPPTRSFRAALADIRAGAR